jgi:RimJ/RimL family protein N-acetyltransferase
MFPNIFQTARLILRPIASADARRIFDGYAQDPDVTRFLTWRPHTRIEQTEAYVARCIEADSSRTYVLTKRSNGKLIGAFDLRNSGRFRVGCGYVLAQSSWGQGLMTEALTEVVCWALSQPDIWRIGDVCDVENHASARVMEKAGLTCEGVARRWIMHPNVSDEPRDCFSYAKVK